MPWGDLEVSARVEELRSGVNQLVFKQPGALGIVSQLMPMAREMVANWKRLHKRNVQATNGLMESLGVLREIFSDYKKQEEEEYVLQQIRRVRVRSFVIKRSVTGVWGSRARSGILGAVAQAGRVVINGVEALVRGVLSVPLLYVIAVLNPLVLLLATTAWIVGFGFCFQDWGHQFMNHVAVEPSLRDWIRHSAVAFMAFGDPKAPGLTEEQLTKNPGYGAFWDITLMEMSLGYLHLGLLVALLVQRITRR